MSPRITTISAVVAGEFENGDVVTVTGIATNLQPGMRTVQGGRCMAFLLISPETAVRVEVLPEVWEQYGHLVKPVPVPSLNPALGNELRPPTLTITGTVERFNRVPGLVASEITEEAR